MLTAANVQLQPQCARRRPTQAGDALRVRRERDEQGCSGSADSAARRLRSRTQKAHAASGVHSGPQSCCRGWRRSQRVQARPSCLVSHTQPHELVTSISALVSLASHALRRRQQHQARRARQTAASAAGFLA